MLILIKVLIVSAAPPYLKQTYTCAHTRVRTHACTHTHFLTFLYSVYVDVSKLWIAFFFLSRKFLCQDKILSDRHFFVFI